MIPTIDITWQIKLIYKKVLETITIKISLLLPRYLIKWCVVRMFGETSTRGYLAKKEAGTITVIEMLDVWDG